MSIPPVETCGSPTALAYVVRELVVEGMLALVADETRLRTIIERLDSLEDGSQEAYAAQAYGVLVPLIRRGQLAILNGYPLDAASLPAISIVDAGTGGEDQGAAVMEDIHHVGHHYEGGLLYEDIHRGTVQNTTLQLGTWTTSPELSALIDVCLSSVLRRDRWLLKARAGVRESSLTESGSETDEQTQVSLRTSYVPMQILSLEWTRVEIETRGPVPDRYRVLPGTFTA